MDYFEIACSRIKDHNVREMLIAKLSDIGYESFVDTKKGFLAYIPESFYCEEHLRELKSLPVFQNIGIDLKKIPEENWNALWEENFQAVIVEDLCLIRAGFHEIRRPDLTEIIIEPKVSFGPGHHATTRMMVRHLFETEIKGRHVLDLGCGTGILAILAEKLGAESVVAVDIEEWAYANTMENIKRNGATKIRAEHGDINSVKEMTFDIILANIHKNVLLEYAADLKNMSAKKGVVVLSGFYAKDEAEIRLKYENQNFEFLKSLSANNWHSMALINQ